MATNNEHIARELEHFVGKTIELAGAGLPYAQVIAHIGKPSAAHLKALKRGEGAASLYPKSELFSEMTFYLGQDGERVASMEFIADPGAFSMHDLRAAFGQWQRSPPEPEEASFAVAWFPKYDTDSGARFCLYAEDGNYGSSIAPDATPARLFIQAQRFRWTE